MKLNKLKSILFSTRDCIQNAVVYDQNRNTDIAEGIVDSIVEEFGNREVKRINTDGNILVITV